MMARRHAWGRGSERGAVLPLALAVLVGLNALSLALLSMSASEPHIARNHVDMVQARYLAEAGIEYAYDVLARGSGSWSAHLAGATCDTGALLAHPALPQASHGSGNFFVRVRNDCEPGDERFTGLPVEDAANAERDTNDTVIVVSTGAVRDTLHTVRVILSRNARVPAVGQTVPSTRIAAYGWADLSNP
jgi:Tfp pilus assembly protein PilX